MYYVVMYVCTVCMYVPAAEECSVSFALDGPWLFFFRLNGDIATAAGQGQQLRGSHEGATAIASQYLAS